MEIKELTTVHDLTHLLQQDILLYWLMGGARYKESQKTSKGNSRQVNAQNWKRIRRNEVSGEQDA